MTMLKQKDVIDVMLDDLRMQLRCIPVYDADGRESWRQAVRQVIHGVKEPWNQWKYYTLVAQDLCAKYPGIQLAMAMGYLRDV